MKKVFEAIRTTETLRQTPTKDADTKKVFEAIRTAETLCKMYEVAETQQERHNLAKIALIGAPIRQSATTDAAFPVLRQMFLDFSLQVYKVVTGSSYDDEILGDALDLLLRAKDRSLQAKRMPDAIAHLTRHAGKE